MYPYRNSFKDFDFSLSFKDSHENIYGLPILKKKLDTGKAKRKSL